MILLYTASTLYHAIPYPQAKKILKKFDHIAIYYLIAGSYTPFLLVNLRGPVGWSIFGIIWSLALAGTVLTGNFGKRNQNLVDILVPDHGLDDCFRFQTIICLNQYRRRGFPDSRGPFLYARGLFLHLEKQKIYPCGMAFYGFGGNGHALLCRALRLRSNLIPELREQIRCNRRRCNCNRSQYCR